VLLGGKAPVQIPFLRFEGHSSNELVNWRTATNWDLTVTLSNGPNTLTVQGYDRLTNFLTWATNTITMTNAP
jgi:hypothetical protein